MAGTPLGNAIEFLQDFGFFEVVLPFILVFTVVFAVLEKTKIFGTVGEGDKAEGKKNINAMVALVIAMLFIGTPAIVDAVNVSLPKVAFVLIAFMSFLMVVGFFYSKGQLEFESMGWKIPLAMSTMTGIALIFLNSLEWWPFSPGAFDDLSGSLVLPVVIFIIVIIGAIILVSVPGGGGNKGKTE
jgi:hypothetical protein